MNKSKVSIVIPVYNSEKYIEDTITTIINQTYENWEALFVDDCSLDKSSNIIKDFATKDNRIKYFKLKENSGNPAIPRNYGIDKATGKYLCFIDSDDLWENEKLEKQIAYMKKNNVAFSYHSYEFANEFGQPNGKKVIAKPKLKYDECLKNNIISTITVMFDLEKIDKSLIYMPNIKYVEDTATWWKIMRNGNDAYGIPNVFSYYRRIPNSNSSNKLRTQKKLWNVYRKEEKLSIIKAAKYLIIKNINAILRRI